MDGGGGGRDPRVADAMRPMAGILSARAPFLGPFLALESGRRHASRNRSCRTFSAENGGPNNGPILGSTRWPRELSFPGH